MWHSWAIKLLISNHQDTRGGTEVGVEQDLHMRSFIRVVGKDTGPHQIPATHFSSWMSLRLTERQRMTRVWSYLLAQRERASTVLARTQAGLVTPRKTHHSKEKGTHLPVMRSISFLWDLSPSKPVKPLQKERGLSTAVFSSWTEAEASDCFVTLFCYHCFPPFFFNPS